MKHILAFLLILAFFTTSPVNISGQNAPSFGKIELLVPKGDRTEEKSVVVKFTADSMTITAKDSQFNKTFLYSDIKTAEYSYSKNPRWKTGLGLGAASIVFPPLLLIAIPVGFTKHRRHWLTVRTEKDYAVLKLSKSTRKCEVNGEVVKSSYLLRKNDFVEIELDEGKETAMQPEPIPLEIVFEDAELVVVNKPAGMLVHPSHAQKTGTLLNALAFYLNNSSQASFVRAGLVHRLDKLTSGLILIAKTARSHRILSDHFRRRLIEKKYFALVDGLVKGEAGTIDAPIGRYAEEKIWNIKADGKRAVTNFWVKERFAGKTLLELEPVTGRTNQLRIHLAHTGHPILGDTVYGGGEFSRLCLHAYKLVFWHPNGGRRLEIEAKIGNFI